MLAAQPREIKLNGDRSFASKKKKKGKEKDASWSSGKRLEFVVFQGMFMTMHAENCRARTVVELEARTALHGLMEMEQ